MASDTDGKIFVTGSQNAEKTSIYDIAAQSWTAGPDKIIAGGYQSSCLASKGEIFQIGGPFTGVYGGEGGTPCKDGEIFRNGKWKLLSGAKSTAYAHN